MRDPYSIIKSRYVTEKAQVLEGLQNASSNPSLARFKQPKIVFLVAIEADKPSIAWAIEEIYKERGIKVQSVNTLRVHPKRKRRGKGRMGATSLFKKAIVTLTEGDILESEGKT